MRLKDLLPCSIPHIQDSALANDPAMTNLLARCSYTTIENHGDGVDFELPLMTIRKTRQVLLQKATVFDTLTVDPRQAKLYGTTVESFTTEALNLAGLLRQKASEI